MDCSKGIPALAEEEVQGLLSQVFLFAGYCLAFLTVPFIVLWLSLAFVTDPFLLFQGLHLLWHASLLREEAQWLEAEGLQKVKMAVAGSEAEHLYGLMRGALLHSSMSSAPPPPKRCHQAPTTTICKLPPQESEKVKPKSSAPAAEGSGLAQEAPSLAVPEALEIAITAHMTPLHLNVGVSKGFINTRLMGSARGCPPPQLPYVVMCPVTIWG